MAPEDGQEKVMGGYQVVLPCSSAINAGAIIACAHAVGMVGGLFRLPFTDLVYGGWFRLGRLHSFLVGFLQYCMYLLEAQQVFP